jgi:hypothetical protein
MNDSSLKSHTAKLKAIGKGWYKSPQGAVRALVKNQDYFLDLVCQTPELAVWLGSPAGQAETMPVQEFIRRARDCMEDETLADAPYVRKLDAIRRGWYASRTSMAQLLGDPQFRMALLELAPEILEWLGASNRNNALSVEEFIHYARGLIRSGKLDGASYTAKLAAISEKKGISEQRVKRFVESEGSYAEVQKRALDVVNWLGKPEEITQSMPPSEFVKRARDLMKGSTIENWKYKDKLVAISKGWYAHWTALRVQLARPKYCAAIKELAPDVIEWLGKPKQQVKSMSAEEFVSRMRSLMDEGETIAGQRREILTKVGRGWYRDPVRRIGKLLKRPKFMNSVVELDPAILAFINGHQMLVVEFAHRVKKLMGEFDGEVLTYNEKLKAIGRGWYEDPVTGCDELLRDLSFRRQVGSIMPGSMSWLDIPQTLATPMSPNEFVLRARKVMKDPRYTNASQTAKLAQIGEGWYKYPRRSMAIRFFTPHFYRAIHSLAHDVVDWIERKESRTVGVSPMPVSVFAKRTRALMENGAFHLSLDRKLSYINGHWFADVAMLYNRFRKPEFISELIELDRDAAYWIDPMRAELVKLHNEWREVGGALVDHKMQPQEAFLQLSRGLPVVEERTPIILASGIWAIGGGRTIQLSTLNKSLEQFQGTSGILALFRNMKIAYAGRPIGIRHIRELPNIIGVDREEVYALLGMNERSETECDWADMNRVGQVYEDLMKGYWHWYDLCQGHMPTYGDYHNQFSEAILHAANQVVKSGVTDPDERARLVRNEIICHVRNEATEQLFPRIADNISRGLYVSNYCNSAYLNGRNRPIRAGFRG